MPPPKTSGDHTSEGKHVGGIVSAGGVRALGMVLTLLLNFGLMRLLGAEGYGVYIFGLSAGLLASVFGRIGVERFGIRLMVPALTDGDYGLLKGILIWAFGVSLLATAMTAVVLSIAAQFVPVYGDALHVSGVIAIVVTLLMACQGALRSSGSTAVAIAPEFVARPFFIIVLILADLLIWPSDGVPDPQRFLVLYCAGTGLAALLSSILVLRRLPMARLAAVKAEFEGGNWFRIALPIYWSNLMLLSQPQLVILIAGAILVPADVGWVGFAIRVATGVSIPLGVVGLYAAPKIVRRYKAQNFAGLQNDLTLYCRVTSLTGFAAAVILALCLWFGVVKLINESFVGAEWLVMTFVFGQFLTALTGPVGAVLAMTNFERAGAGISTVSLILLLIVGLGAGSLFGMYGIALASIVAVGFRSAANFLVAKRKLNVWALPVGAGIFSTEQTR